MKKVMLTGATGFIGSHLVSRLSNQGYQVGILVRKTSDTEVVDSYVDVNHMYQYNGKIEDIVDCLKDFQPDVVIHTAAFFVAEHKSEQVDQLLDSNIRFSTHLFEAMAVVGINNLINTSTSWQHYQNMDYNPVCLYAATKQCVEDILRYYVETSKIHAVTLEIFDSYGTEDRRGKLVSLFQKIAGTSDRLAMSGGEQEIDLVYIDDIMDAYQLVLERMIKKHEAGFEKYELTSGKGLPLKKVAKIFEQVYQTELPIDWGAREYRKREVMKCYTCGNRLEGWSPKVSLEEGFRRISEGN